MPRKYDMLTKVIQGVNQSFRLSNIISIKQKKQKDIKQNLFINEY